MPPEILLSNVTALTELTATNLVIVAGKGGEGRSTYLAAELDPHDQINYGFGIVFRFR